MYPRYISTHHIHAGFLCCRPVDTTFSEAFKQPNQLNSICPSFLKAVASTSDKSDFYTTKDSIDSRCETPPKLMASVVFSVVPVAIQVHLQLGCAPRNQRS